MCQSLFCIIVVGTFLLYKLLLQFDTITHCLLYLQNYAKMLDAHGPRWALEKSTHTLALAFLLSGCLLQSTLPYVDTIPFYHQITRLGLFVLFVVQNSFVQLLHTQHWSFLSSIVPAQEGSVWFAPLSGLGSLASTMAGFAVTPLLHRYGFTGLLWVASLCLWSAAWCSEQAYEMAEQVRQGFRQLEQRARLLARIWDPLNGILFFCL
jgi:hypothetical protein